MSASQDFDAPDDPLANPELLRILVALLMDTYKVERAVFTQADFDRIRGKGLQGEYVPGAFILHLANSVHELPEPPQ